jgi:sugar phosphate isomerase/epimerase
VAEDARQIAALAAQEGIRVACEFHGGTLTDTAESARHLLEMAGHPNLRTYWQPPVGMAPETACGGLRLVLPWLENVHVFHWRDHERLPLTDGAAAWADYFRILRSVPGRHGALLEFVKDDAPASCLADAATLRTWLTT